MCRSRPRVESSALTRVHHAARYATPSICVLWPMCVTFPCDSQRNAKVMWAYFNGLVGQGADDGSPAAPTFSLCLFTFFTFLICCCCRCCSSWQVYCSFPIFKWPLLRLHYLCASFRHVLEIHLELCPILASNISCHVAKAASLCVPRLAPRGFSFSVGWCGAMASFEMTTAAWCAAGWAPTWCYFFFTAFMAPCRSLKWAMATDLGAVCFDILIASHRRLATLMAIAQWRLMSQFVRLLIAMPPPS